MRGTEYLFLVVILGVFIWLTVQGATELNDKFTANPIDVSNFTGYEDFSKVTEQANSSFNKFQVLGDTDASWFQKIGAGIVAIPYAVIIFPIMVATAVYALSTMITNGLGGWVPPIIIMAIITFLLIEIVRRFLEFFQRSRA